MAMPLMGPALLLLLLLLQGHQSHKHKSVTSSVLVTIILTASNQHRTLKSGRLGIRPIFRETRFTSREPGINGTHQVGKSKLLSSFSVPKTPQETAGRRGDLWSSRGFNGMGTSGGVARESITRRRLLPQGRKGRAKQKGWG